MLLGIIVQKCEWLSDVVHGLHQVLFSWTQGWRSSRNWRKISVFLFFLFLITIYCHLEGVLSVIDKLFAGRRSYSDQKLTHQRGCSLRQTWPTIRQHETTRPEKPGSPQVLWIHSWASGRWARGRHEPQSVWRRSGRHRLHLWAALTPWVRVVKVTNLARICQHHPRPWCWRVRPEYMWYISEYFWLLLPRSSGRSSHRRNFLSLV